ncbi:MAG: type 1 glutamine amidotransferase [Bradymonadaceae bacterium]
MSSKSLRVLLVQARTLDDPMRAHELAAFSRQTRLDEGSFSVFNMAIDAFDDFATENVDCVMVGGSGAFSLVDSGFSWHEDFLKLMRELVRRKVPTFASCFGFQAIIQALGGRLGREADRAELGTLQVSLTDEGREDPLFGRLPGHFDAQFGHNDSALLLPDELVHLAMTPRCLYQAIRVRDTPIVATQFHPELQMSDNLDRFRNYLDLYKPPDHDYDQAIAYAKSIHRPSPHSGELLRLFLEDVAARG